ncbi:Guanine nucleotide-binding protein subunit alpha-13 [Dermatophagoides farinae]|uniref:Guanine nucleotide-binding protein subunit alpha-13 n=1 Tax=Dermatophagoides farinae TaxID=6954 RepID=A0A922HT10_DERFA|nr:Guanine nucleotide-binding protein subunit alpha-13 [Dermatophagoides farinae]
MIIPRCCRRKYRRCYKSCIGDYNNNNDDGDDSDDDHSDYCDEMKENRRIEKWLKQEKHRLKRQIRILLLGTGESGKSTVLKQMKIIHGQNLGEGQQLEELRHVIYFNILKGIKVLIDARAKLSIPWSDKTADIQSKADLVFRAETNNLITFEYFSRYTALIDLIWNDDGIQTTFQKRNEYQLSDGLPYLFRNLKRISSHTYVPNNQDLLHARVPTRTVLEYTVDYKSVAFHFIDVGGQRKQRKKWLQCFDNMLTSILFIVSSIEYDQYLVEDTSVNRLDETLAVFELIINSDYFHHASIILFLNKTDLLAEKLKQTKKIKRSITTMDNILYNYHRPQLLNELYPQYSGDPFNLQQVQQFLQTLFEQRRSYRPLYTHFTTAVDTENIKRVFNDVRETVLHENIKSIINLQ